MSKTVKELIKAMHDNQQLSGKDIQQINDAIACTICEYLHENFDKERKHLYFCKDELQIRVENVLGASAALLFSGGTFFMYHGNMELCTFELPYIFETTQTQKQFMEDLAEAFGNEDYYDVNEVMYVLQYNGI